MMKLTEFQFHVSFILYTTILLSVLVALQFLVSDAILLPHCRGSSKSKIMKRKKQQKENNHVEQNDPSLKEVD
ncbi:hypothetical protein SNEBB_007717 [Seison nebaliae]|nr:hypothetical protein SNEBB_007717 [Seison nebaliae]